MCHTHAVCEKRAPFFHTVVVYCVFVCLVLNDALCCGCFLLCLLSVAFVCWIFCILGVCVWCICVCVVCSVILCFVCVLCCVCSVLFFCFIFCIVGVCVCFVCVCVCVVCVC